jgi:hypothetical protein
MNTKDQIDCWYKYKHGEGRITSSSSAYDSSCGKHKATKIISITTPKQDPGIFLASNPGMHQ